MYWDAQDYLTPVCLNRRSSHGYEFQKKRVPKDFHKKLSQFPNGSKRAIIPQRSLFVSLPYFRDGSAEGNCRICRINLEL
jgi:hypothetical protein